MENTIYIQNLEKNIDVAELCDIFRIYGKILSASIEHINNKPVGKAEITFGDYASALNSVKFMNGKIIKKKNILVSFIVENAPYKKIFVKNLCLEWDEADLLRIFSSSATVETAKISEERGKSNGYGFITFLTHAGAENAIKQFNGLEINGQKLIVERFRSKSERCKLLENSVEHAEELLEKSVQHNNLFIKNLPKEMREAELKDFFSRYGSITSYKIAYDETGMSKGFGFVCFRSVEDADKALKRTNGVVLHGKKLQVNFKQDRYARKHYLNLKNKDSELKVKEYKQRSKSVSVLQFHPHAVGRTLMKI